MEGDKVNEFIQLNRVALLYVLHQVAQVLKRDYITLMGKLED